ncbi:MAG: Hpt domain-containing protein [Balneolia bacterium]|nr:Hpt domain-containing protein [Balneolia bacterium]
MEMIKQSDEMGSITDLSYLRNVSDGNKEFMDEMINLFIDQSDGHLDSIREGIDQNDFEIVARAAHKMKPVLGYVGINPEKYFLQEIELKAKAGEDMAGILALHSKLIGIINQANEELRGQLSTSS